MIGVSVVSNINKASQNFKGAPARLEKATERALNRAVDTAGTIANRKIRERYNVKLATVSKSLKKQYASRKAVVVYSELRVRGSPIPLSEFSPIEKTVSVKANRFGRTRYAVSVRVLRAGQRKTVKGGFMVTTGGSLAGKRGIFKRVGAARYPIKFLSSVSIPTAFLNETVLKAVKSEGTASFNKNLAQQLKFLESKSNG